MNDPTYTLETLIEAVFSPPIMLLIGILVGFALAMYGRNRK